MLFLAQNAQKTNDFGKSGAGQKMGGYGSGRWHWHTKKDTVEDCFTLSITMLMKRVFPPSVFTERRNWQTSVVWSSTRTSETLATIAVFLFFRENGQHMSLAYNANGQSIMRRIELVTTPCNYGSVRYWFDCPKCGRRSSNLYLPRYSGSHEFCCRYCHNLSYTSSQEAHKYDRGAVFGVYAGAIDRLIRAEKINQKLQRTRWGSKHWQRLFKRYMETMAAIPRVDTP